MNWDNASKDDEQTCEKIGSNRKWEWRLSSLFLVFLGILNLIAFFASVFLVPAGEIFGSVFADRAFAVLMAITANLYFFAAYVISYTYICRFCTKPMKPDQFRCRECGKHNSDRLAS